MVIGAILGVAAIILIVISIVGKFKTNLDFLDAVGGAEENGIELTVQVDENTPPLEMLNCFDVGALIVDTPKDSSRTGYQLSGNCDWEEEHGIEIVILDNKLVYLGEFNGESPWSDHSGESWNAAASIAR